MAITTVPFYSINSAYRPNQFVCDQVTANTLVLAEADVYVDGSLVTTIRKAPFLILFGNTYYFKFDVSKVLQTQCAPRADQLTSIFDSTLGNPYTATNVDCHAEYYIDVTYYYRDGTTNLLTDLGVTDTSSTYQAIIATRQLREDMDLTSYAMVGPFTRFLTNRPIDGSAITTIELCSSENYYISGIPYLSNAFEIRTFDSSGTPIDVGLASIAATGDYTPFTFGLGVPNLTSQTYFDGSVNINNPNVAFYTMQVGFATFSGSWSFVGRTQVLRFNLVDCCDTRKFRLHWMNRLGGAESYTFSSKLTKEETNRNNIAQKPQFWGLSAPPTYPYTRGRFKIENSGEKQYKAESVYFNEDDGAWIAELLTSPETYWEVDGELVNVLVNQSSITISETDELVKLDLVILEGDEISLQQF